MGVCVNAYVLIYVNAYMPPGLYNQVLNKGQKSPKANYAFRKKNLEEKKCLDQLGKKLSFWQNGNCNKNFFNVPQIF
jgi:hypothetical protein